MNFSATGVSICRGRLAYKEEDEEGSSILRASALETTEKKEN